MNIKLGDRVSVLDEDISGVVTSFQGDALELETEDGFRMLFPVTKVVVIPPDAMMQIPFGNADIDRKIDKPTRKTSKSSSDTKRGKVVVEVDLHIEKLVPRTDRLQAGEILEIQLGEAKRQIEFALRKSIPRLVFIHGVGEGVLKMELEALFRRYTGLQYYDASYRKYGMGATEVRLEGNLNSRVRGL